VPVIANSLSNELDGLERGARQRCMNTGDLSACRSVLTPARVLTPVGGLGRQYLVQLALESGGASAFERLTADTGVTLEHRLAAAAGVPIDTLLNRWGASLRAVPRACSQELLLGPCPGSYWRWPSGSRWR
jgi:hypothetical protein